MAKMTDINLVSRSLCLCSVPVEAIGGLLRLRTHVPEGEHKNVTMFACHVCANDHRQEAHRRHARNIKNQQWLKTWSNPKPWLSDLIKQRTAWALSLHYSFFSPVTNILSFSLIIVCEWFQNEQTNPDGRVHSQLFCVEHYVILKEGWKCLSVCR